MLNEANDKTTLLQGQTNYKYVLLLQQGYFFTGLYSIIGPRNHQEYFTARPKKILMNHVNYKEKILSQTDYLITGHTIYLGEADSKLTFFLKKRINIVGQTNNKNTLLQDQTSNFVLTSRQQGYFTAATRSIDELYNIVGPSK